MKYIFPNKIIEAKKVKNADLLLKNKSLQIGLNEIELTTFIEGSYVVLDYAKEMCGGVRILTHVSDGAVIRIRFGESLSECHVDVGCEQNATNDHSLRDFTTQLVSYSDMTFANTGYRFIRIDMIKGSATIKNVLGTNRILSKKTKWKYCGGDKKISEIFNTAKRTIDLCANGEYLWDGIKRDRLVWVGDMHPEMLALTTLYGRLPIIEKSLDFIKKQTPLPKWMNNFPTYSMWWIIIVADYSAATDAEDFTEKQIDYIKGLIDLMSDNVSKDGELRYPFLFVDWQTHEKPDEIQGSRAINIIAVKKAIEVLKRFNENTDKAEDLLKRLLKKEITVDSSKSVLGLKYFAVGLTESDKKKLLENGVSGFSTFMSYYILKAIASFDKEKAVEMLKEYYGAMLNKGATSFWEDFDISWAENSCRIDEMPKKGEKDIHGDFGAHCYTGFRHSLCHGWSAGVIKFIKDEIYEKS